MRITNEWVRVQAQTLAPFYYHGLYARDGSATHPDMITDTAFMFALQAALLPCPVPILRATPDYRADLAQIRWRTSLLWGDSNDMMAPVRHTTDVEREGGYHENIQKNMASGLFKKTFFVHEVAMGALYHGLILGPNPFNLLKTDKFVIRVGAGKLGLLEISRNDNLKEVRLNTATAKLFKRDLPEAYRILDTIRVSQPFSIKEAKDELRHWQG